MSKNTGSKSGSKIIKTDGETKKNIFLYLPTSFYYLSYSIYTQDPFDIVNPGGMQDTCHMRT